MAQIVRRTAQPPRRNKGQQFAEAFSNLAQDSSNYLYQKHLEDEEDKTLKEMGIDAKGLRGKTREDFLNETFKQRAKTEGRQNLFNNLPSNRQKFSDQINSPEETGALDPNEFAGSSPKQEISNLKNKLQEFEDEEYENPRGKKSQKPKSLPPLNLPYSPEDIQYLQQTSPQDARVALEMNNAEQSRYNNAAKEIQANQRHAENLALKEKSLKHHQKISSPEHAAEKERLLLDVARDNEVFKNVDSARSKAGSEEASLMAVEDAVINGNQDFLSYNNLAELTGLELFRDAAGGEFKTGVKTFLINSVGKFGARPNQYIETQMADALPKVGRTRSANMMTINALKFDKDLNNKYIEVSDEVRNEKFKPGEAGQLIQNRMKSFVEDRQKELKKNYEYIKENQEKIDATPEGKVPMKSSKGTLLWMPKDKIYEALLDGSSFI